MKDEEFKQKLAEVADWEIPKTPRETSLSAKKKRGRKSSDDAYMELCEEIFHEEFNGINPTYPLMLTRIKRCGCNCEDCGQYCPNGREKEAKLQKKGKKQVWRQKCLTCGKSQDPFTGKFNLTGSEATIKFNDFMRETKGVYKTKGNEERKRVMVERNKTVIETDCETITYYHEKNHQA